MRGGGSGFCALFFRLSLSKLLFGVHVMPCLLLRLVPKKARKFEFFVSFLSRSCDAQTIFFC